MKYETRVKTANIEDMVGKYINEVLYTDIRPIGKVIGTRGKTILIVADITVRREQNWKPKMEIGGFSAVCVNNGSQQWTFEVDETKTKEIRWSKQAMAKGFMNKRGIIWSCDSEARYYYDYNF